MFLLLCLCFPFEMDFLCVLMDPCVIEFEFGLVFGGQFDVSVDFCILLLTLVEFASLFPKVILLILIEPFVL